METIAFLSKPLLMSEAWRSVSRHGHDPERADAEAGLADWRKLGQGLHARYLVDSFADGARLVAAIGEAGDAVGHHPCVVIGDGHVDLELVTADAIYRDDDGTEYVVEWPTQQDVDLARTITSLAGSLGLVADPASVAVLESGSTWTRRATSLPCGPRC